MPERLPLALSIQQPWAWLIVNGYKDVENRTWPTQVRGRVLVHTGQRFDREGYEWVRVTFPEIPMPHPSSFERGGVVGEVEIIGQSRPSPSPWYAPGQWAFWLFDARPLPFTPGPGRLGFFRFVPRVAPHA